MKAALAVLSLALAALGVLGWADKARGFDALAHWGDPVALIAALHPLWPIYFIAAIGCIAAQILGACVVVNFAERLKDAKSFWRYLALGFYGVAAVFAAISADIGAKAIIGAPYRAAYEARLVERAALTAEITAIRGRLGEAQARLDAIDPTTTYTSRLQEARAAFEATTAVDRQRLPTAQAELDARPALPRERPEAPWELALLVIFLAWGLLEPWGYALGEIGRTEIAPAPGMRRARMPRQRLLGLRWPPWARTAAAAVAMASAPAAAAAAPETSRTESVVQPQNGAPASETPAKPARAKPGTVPEPTAAEIARAARAVVANGKTPSVSLVRDAINAEREKKGIPLCSRTRLHRSEAWQAKWAPA